MSTDKTKKNNKSIGIRRCPPTKHYLGFFLLTPANAAFITEAPLT
jgi:hypothetical protein